ncbi:NnrU family protein [Sphingomonas arenae]|uniref:NnrU family protein n=1 Tax=Sphingomonas arenae TaxID=2812555 RepID=UPI001967CE12|nr:NnrU family protein [Sphingomonas arenae]
MTEFLLALALFLVAHSIPARPAIRARFVAVLGERHYLLLYSLLSLALLAWLISAAVRAPTIPLWPTSLWSYQLAVALMLPASWLLIGGLASPNPFSISLSRRSFDAERPGIVGWMRHPVLWGFATWALVHTVANGDLVALIMFGGFLLFSLAGMKLVERRRKRQLSENGEALPRLGKGWNIRQLLVTCGGGTLFYALLLNAHPWLFGPNPAAVVLG